MKYGIAKMPLIPGRKDGSDRSEMVTQLLFGECYEVLEEREKWIFIRNHRDAYECWIDRKQHFEISEHLFSDLSNAASVLTAEPLEKLARPDFLWIPFGSRINTEIESINLGDHFSGLTASFRFDEIEKYSKKFLGAPYLWGGKSILGIDCSGFCQVVFSACGIQLPRDAYQQAELGKTVEFLEQSKLGDLAYFDNKDGKITHVGILLSKEEIIHSSGMVRIDKIDHQGIFNSDLSEYTHKLRIIKRINS